MIDYCGEYGANRLGEIPVPYILRISADSGLIFAAVSFGDYRVTACSSELMELGSRVSEIHSACVSAALYNGRHIAVAEHIAAESSK